MMYVLKDNDITDIKVYSKSARQTVRSVIFEGLEADLQDVFA